MNAHYTGTPMSGMSPLKGAWIDRAETLLEYLDSVAGAPWLALDTEFLRLHTYYPNLCLIQISDGAHHALIDTKAGLDLSPLIDRLRRSESTCVLHACLQDIEIFHHDFELIPESVFDTQVATALLGRGFQLSYAALVEDRLGLALDKSQVRSWWDRRPLSEAQIQYALADVVHLGPIYRQLTEELEAAGRLPWLREEMARTLVPSTWVPDPEQIWRRVRSGAVQVPGSRRHVLQGLARWRELRARSRDRARPRVVSDEVLARLACAPLSSRKDFRRIVDGALPEHLHDTLWQALQEAEAAPPLNLKSLSRQEREEQNQQVRKLAGVARQVADDVREVRGVHRRYRLE